MSSCLQKLKLALIQSAVLANKELNIERTCKFIKEAAQNGAKLICLPECFNCPYGIKYFNEYAEEIPGFTSTALSKSAKDNKIYLIGGTFPERYNGKLYNTCLAYGPDGEVIVKHRKEEFCCPLPPSTSIGCATGDLEKSLKKADFCVHLFDIDIPGKITFKESTCLSAGDNLTIFSIDKWKIGLGICYDIRFPLMANIYAEKGCQLLVYPGAFNMTTGPAHWELLQRARAVDNQLYVAAVSPARDVSASYVSWGHSSLVSPWGDIVCSADENEKIIYGEIDMSYVDEIRAQIPIRNQQRHDIYTIKCTKEF